MSTVVSQTTRIFVTLGSYRKHGYIESGLCFYHVMSFVNLESLQFKTHHHILLMYIQYNLGRQNIAQPPKPQQQPR
jgi:hypothetical protein